MKGAGPVLVTRHGKPAGVIIGFPTEADYLDWKIENDPRFRVLMEKSLAQKAAGKTVSAAQARAMLLDEDELQTLQEAIATSASAGAPCLSPGKALAMAFCRPVRE